MNAVDFADDAYDRLVEAGRALHPYDIARFQRPAVRDFDDDEGPYFQKEAEFHRWYELDGTARPRPLDFDELMAVLQEVNGWTEDVAERTAAFDSYARPGDRERWDRVIALGYEDWTSIVAAEEGLASPTRK